MGKAVEVTTVASTASQYSEPDPFGDQLLPNFIRASEIRTPFYGIDESADFLVERGGGAMMGHARVTIDRSIESDDSTRKQGEVAIRIGRERGHCDDVNRLALDHERASAGQIPAGVLEPRIGAGSRAKTLGVVQSQPCRSAKSQIWISGIKGRDNGRENCRVGKIDARK